MFDLLKANRINKITDTHAEKISDYLILMNSVNSQEAKKNLSPEEYKRFLQTFDILAKRRDEISANRLQYEHRAFAIAYEFDWGAQVPYEKICGEAEDILYMFINMKPKYEELVEGLVENYEMGVNLIADMKTIPYIKVWSYAVELFESSSATVLSSYKSLLNDYFTRYVYEIASRKMYLTKVVEKADSSVELKECDACRDTMKKISRAAYDNNDSLDGYLTQYQDSFFNLCGVECPTGLLKAFFRRPVEELKNLAEKEG